MDTVGDLLGPTVCVYVCVCACVHVYVSEREVCDILLTFIFGEAMRCLRELMY